jgi:biotin synthase-related radical SAM superfamily protein
MAKRGVEALVAATLNERAMAKAELISAGYVFVDPSVGELEGLAHSTAGPDAGESALTFEWEGTRVRMRLSDDPRSEFRLVDEGEGLAIWRRGTRFIDGVRYLPNLMHAPGQAFVNIESGCAMDCKFCATPHLKKETRKRVKKEEWLAKLLEAAKRDDLTSIGITAGVSGIPGKTLADMEWLVKELRKRLPEMPIGVEPYVETEGEIDRLKAAGATEMKINLQSFDRDVFAKVCPDWDFDRLLRLIAYAAKKFGRERVTGNMLIGMGESDESVQQGMAFLIGHGIVPTVRSLRWNDINREHLEEALGGRLKPVSAERMVRLAKVQQELLDQAGLNVLNYKTMCHACRACDIVPQVDLIQLK